jgi:transcriptional regulator with XRE-family HTH domain
MRLPDYLKKIGRNIKNARERKGLRQIDVYEKTGLTYRHYQNIEAGRINLTVSTLCRLSKLFETKVSDLIEGC